MDKPILVRYWEYLESVGVVDEGSPTKSWQSFPEWYENERKEQEDEDE